MKEIINSLLERLEGFRESCKKKNWNGEGTLPVNPDSIDAAKIYIGKMMAIDFTKNEVLVFPKLDGGVQIEIGDYVEVEFHGYTAVIYYFDNAFVVEHESVFHITKQ